MTAILFRKVIVDGVSYYQVFKEEEGFFGDVDIADFEHREEKDLFYIDADSDIEIPNLRFLNMYYVEDDKLKEIEDDDLHRKVMQAFADKYHLVIRRLKSPDEVVDTVKEKILFQDSCVRVLVNQLYLNQAIVISDMPMEIKMEQKNNILFHGRKGSGKKTIIEGIEDGLLIPYADITISSDIENTLDKMITMLLERANDKEELASTGIVFIRDNYKELYNSTGQNIYAILEHLTNLGKINYHGKIIDFRTITFVILLDDYQQTKQEDIDNFQNMANCTVNIQTNKLTNSQKYNVLWSDNGRLTHYERFLNDYGKKIIVDTSSILDLINKCSEVDTGMGLLNLMIDTIVKATILCGISDVVINRECINQFLPIIDSYTEDERPEEEKRPKENDKYAFEKQVDRIVNKVKEDVVGQDRAVKTIVYQLANNILWANKKDLENPKNYIKNILIRGKPGTGKTFISNKVLGYFGVPYYIADATEYTEAGYIGKDVEDMLVDLYHAAGDDLEKAERGVLVIDEIDKRASKAGGGVRDVGGSGVQEALYKFAEGTIIKINIGNRMNEVPVYFDTSRLTIICSGAFEGIEDYRDERIGKRKAGFGDHKPKEEDSEIIDADYITYGMKSQFMRRVKHIVELKDPTKEQFIDIMKNSNSSALEIEKNTLADRGIELEYTEDFYEALANKAVSMKQGVTGIEKSLIKVFQSINIQDIRASEVKKIILNAEVINDPNKVELIPRVSQKVKRK